MRKFLSATMLATSLIVAGGAFTVPAFAEVVYNRGNAADPESRRPAQDVDCLRSARPARPVRRSGHAGHQDANLIPGAAESWTVSDDGTVYTFKLRQGRGRGPTAARSRPMISSIPSAGSKIRQPAAEYASMLYPS